METIDTRLLIDFNIGMKIKERTTYDLDSEQFRYLKREESSNFHRVDINELNKKLNETKKTSFYTTTLVVIVCFSFLTALVAMTEHFVFL